MYELCHVLVALAIILQRSVCDAQVQHQFEQLFNCAGWSEVVATGPYVFTTAQALEQVHRIRNHVFAISHFACWVTFDNLGYLPLD